MTTVLFDDQCMLCRTLAGWGASRAGGEMQFVSWQAHYGAAAGDPVALRVLSGERELDGVEAWEFLLTHFPDFSALNWVAEKLGVRSEIARSLNQAGSFSRRLCRGCGEKPWAR